MDTAVAERRMSLHDHMKSLETPTKMTLDSDYFMLRVDGRAFHTWCKGFAKPYDETFMAGMDAVALALTKEISGAVAAFAQSDEVSVLIKNTPVGRKDVRSPWFGGDVVKMTTIAASLSSVTLTRLFPEKKPALFDARVMEIPVEDISRYFFWRQRDTIKNSVTMCAEFALGKKTVLRKNTDERRQMLMDAGFPWEQAPAGFRMGRFIFPVRKRDMVTYVDKRTGQEQSAEREYLDWQVHPAPAFTPDGTEDLLRDLTTKRSIAST